jgi:hypothetical protein
MITAMETSNSNHSEESLEIAREKRMAESGNYESVDLSFVPDLVAKAEKLRQQAEDIDENSHG